MRFKSRSILLLLTPILAFGFLLPGASYKFTELGIIQGGYEPSSSVLELADKRLYGTTRFGGSERKGTIFRMQADGSDYTELYSFGISEERNPNGSLVGDGDRLFGTANGGSHNQGILFSLEEDGTGFTALHHLGGSEGSNPTGLILVNDILFGVSAIGGSNQAGTLFKINTDGTGFTLLHEFSENEGQNPTGLSVMGNVLFETTTYGGAHFGGNIFKIQTDGTGFEVLHPFDGANASNPLSPPIVLGEVLYGTTQLSNWGTLYSINADGSNFQVRHMFDFFTGGGTPTGPLMVVEGLCYGTNDETSASDDFGSIFRVKATGEDYSILHKFNPVEDGVSPISGLLLVDEILYGSTSGGGGEGNDGTIYRIHPDGSNFEVIYRLPDTLGGRPIISVAAGNVLYGWIFQGGIRQSEGAIFRINTDGTGFTLLHEFKEPNSGNPWGRLVLDNNVLYGITQFGGSFNAGSIFRIQTDGSGFSIVHEFDGQQGYLPNGGLATNDGWLYGTTNEISENSEGRNGLIYRIRQDGSDFTILHNFSGSDGNSPSEGLLLKGVILLGTANGYISEVESGNTPATIFKINTDGSGFEVLHSFAISDGRQSQPQQGLQDLGAFIIGSTQPERTGTGGSLFKLNFAGDPLTVEVQYLSGNPEVLVLGEPGLIAEIQWTPKLDNPIDWQSLNILQLTGDEQIIADTSYLSPSSRFYRGVLIE